MYCYLAGSKRSNLHCSTLVEEPQEGRVVNRRLHTQEREPIRCLVNCLHRAQLIKERGDIPTKNTRVTIRAKQLDQAGCTLLQREGKGSISLQKESSGTIQQMHYTIAKSLVVPTLSECCFFVILF